MTANRSWRCGNRRRAGRLGSRAGRSRPPHAASPGIQRSHRRRLPDPECVAGKPYYLKLLMYLAGILAAEVEAGKVVRTLPVIETLTPPRVSQTYRDHSTSAIPVLVISLLLFMELHLQATRASPLNPRGQVQTGRAAPLRSCPGLHIAPAPHGLGEHRDPDPDPPALSSQSTMNCSATGRRTHLTPAPAAAPPPGAWLQTPPVRGSPAVPGGQEQWALCCTPRQLAVGLHTKQQINSVASSVQYLQQGPPPQKVGPHGSTQVES